MAEAVAIASWKNPNRASVPARIFNRPTLTMSNVVVDGLSSLRQNWSGGLPFAGIQVVEDS